MAYNPYFPMSYQQGYPQNYPQSYPQNYQQNMPQQNPPQNNGMVWVQGLEGAKAHVIGAGQSILLMDSETNCFYLKSADQNGMPSLRIFDYTERTSTPPEPKNDDLSGFVKQDELSAYATKKDLENAFEKLKKEISGKGKKVKADE